MTETQEKDNQEGSLGGYAVPPMMQENIVIDHYMSSRGWDWNGREYVHRKTEKTCDRKTAKWYQEGMVKGGPPPF